MLMNRVNYLPAHFVEQRAGTIPDYCRMLDEGEVELEVEQTPAFLEQLKQLPIEPEPVYFCAACDTAITTPKLAIQINGTHVHSFHNPANIRFELGCFKEALGCEICGTPTSEHTWFPGYTWRYLHCCHCRLHLGWLFEASATDYFHGLILTRLREAATPPD